MAVRRLFRKHDPAAQAKYQDLKQLARAQARILAGTPGTLKQRTQSGKQYWVREYIRVDGKKSDEYIGAVHSIPKTAIEQFTEQLELAKALAAGSANLRLFGYQRIDRKPAAVLEVVFNKGLFQAGLTLIGSHAYGALLNELGIIAPGYGTDDVDLAVPGMPSHRPSASFKLPSAETLAVDLLVPGKNPGEVIEVAELAAHAQTIPLLEFLVADTVEGVALSPNQVIPVRIPSPERFALHKIFASQSRTGGARDKAGKDLEQAAALIAAVEEQTPGRLLETFRAFPRDGKSAVKRGSVAVGKMLESAHPEARAALSKIAR